MKNKEKLTLLPFWIVTLILLSVIIFLSLLMLNQRVDKNPEVNGWVIYRTILLPNTYDSFPREFDYYIMDGNGNQIQWLGQYRGSPVWSPDGKYIAVNCRQNVYQLCILDVSTIHNQRPLPLDSLDITLPSYAKKMDLPEQCDGLISREGGLESISWSPDGKEILVVCGNQVYFPQEEQENTERIVCILEFEDGASNCWKDFPISVWQAYWSPTEELLVISKNVYSEEYDPEKFTYYRELYELYLVDPAGNSPVFLAKGTSPAWSPDGERIAFIADYQYGESEISGSGIAVINKDGSGLHWLYENQFGANIFTQCNYVCKLSWSPDGRYIVIGGEILKEGNFQLVRLDLETGEIVNLTGGDYNKTLNTLPDWGEVPIDYNP